MSRLTTQEAISIAALHMKGLARHEFDLLTVEKPVSPDAAVNLAKIISKLSPLVGNLIEFNTCEYLSDKPEFKGVGKWRRQDPGFPDAIFEGDIHPMPGFETKAWFPLATEITARFKDSQNHFTDDRTYVAMLAWLPEHLIFGKPYILDVGTVSGASVAKARDSHYHNPPDYLVLEPEDTSRRTRNLQQTNTNGYKFQGTEAEFRQAQADVAVTAHRRIVRGENAAFALCRPPGHHAGRDFYGGYCFLNNAAIAAQAFIDSGAARVAVLDVDFHHGNGTQEIFYRRNDVLFCSLHGHPEDEYPYFSGFVDETGEGNGNGFNANFPLRPGAAWDVYADALAAACRKIWNFGPDVLVVSLGVDTFKRDPISSFKLTSEDYLRLGAAIAGLHYPTLFVMEGGYAVDEIGVNTVNVLTSFEGGRH